MGSKGVGYRYRTVLLFLLLGFELLCQIDMGVGNLETINDTSDSANKAGNKGFLIDAVAVPERVPVKQNIVCHGSPVSRKKKVDAEATEKVKEARIGVVNGGIAVRPGPDNIGSEVIWEVPSIPDLPSNIDAGKGVSNTAAYVGNAVESEAVLPSQCYRPPLALEEDVAYRFIVKLILPAFRIGRIDRLMDEFLAVLGIGMTSHYPHIKFEGVHTKAVFTVESEGQVCDPRIGPVIADEAATFGVLRCIYVLTH